MLKTLQLSGGGPQVKALVNIIFSQFLDLLLLCHKTRIAKPCFKAPQNFHPVAFFNSCVGRTEFLPTLCTVVLASKVVRVFLRPLCQTVMSQSKLSLIYVLYFVFDRFPMIKYSTLAMLEQSSVKSQRRSMQIWW